MAPPLVVIEIVSPGELQRDSPEATFYERDCIAKRSQYQDVGIPEYWIIDPQAKIVIILELLGTSYTEVNTFKDNDVIRSPQFGTLNVTVAQLLTAVD